MAGLFNKERKIFEDTIGLVQLLQASDAWL